MKEPETTTTIHIDTLTGRHGSLSISYVPEQDDVYITATDSADMRHKPQMVVLGKENFARFKALMTKVDLVISNEKAKMRLRELGNSGVQQNGDTVSVPLGASSISLPKDLYEQVATLVSTGQTLVAASRLSAALPWLGMEGSRAVAQSICEFLQATGARS